MVRRVMVAGNQHQTSPRLAVQGRHEVVIKGLGRLRRIGRIEHIPGNQHRIDLKFAYLLQEPLQEKLLLLLSGLLVEHLPQVPIGGVQDSKGIGGLLTHRVTI